MAKVENGHRELLISWLNDAYALEQSLIPILQNHAKDAKDHPIVRERLERHLEETRRHAELVKQCVEQLGSSTSAMKTGMGRLSGMFQAVSTGMSSDELVKNNIADYAAEHFEIACYRSLIAAANDVGERRIAQVCEEILHDEEDMAHFLEQQLPQTTTEVLHEYAATHGG
jgi:ferritin-like metal-binding protein YciE